MIPTDAVLKPFRITPGSLAQAHQKSDRLVAIWLFAIAVGTRILFTSRFLFHWDSVNFALALTGFDTRIHRPQPPGYILYIGIGKVLSFIVNDPHTVFVTISIVSSATTVVLLFWLGRQFFSPFVSVAAALFLLTSPLYWYNSEVALPYVLEGMLGVALALVFLFLSRGESRLQTVAAVFFAAAVGFRQQLVIYFIPLAIYAYWKYGFRVWLKSLIWFSLVCLLWFLPMIALSGGWEGYQGALQAVAFGDITRPTSFLSLRWVGLLRNILYLGLYTGYASNLLAIPFLIFVLAWIRNNGLLRIRKSEAARFLALWAIPSILFYSFFHIGSSGLIFVFFPAIVLGSARALEAFSLIRADDLGRSVTAVGFFCVVNIFLFLIPPTDWFTSGRLHVPNYDDIRGQDRSLEERVGWIQMHTDPTSSVVLANNWRQAEYYLPAFTVVSIGPAPPSMEITVVQNQVEKHYAKWDPGLLSPGTKTVILFDPLLVKVQRGAAKPEWETFGEGSLLPVFHLGSTPLTVDIDSFTVN